MRCITAGCGQIAVWVVKNSDSQFEHLVIPACNLHLVNTITRSGKATVMSVLAYNEKLRQGRLALKESNESPDEPIDTAKKPRRVEMKGGKTTYYYGDGTQATERTGDLFKNSQLPMALRKPEVDKQVIED